MSSLLDIVLGTAAGLVSSSVFVLALFIGFCVLFGFMKVRQTSGRGRLIKSLDEVLTHEPMRYHSPSDPRGIADQLSSPELLETAQRKS